MFIRVPPWPPVPLIIPPGHHPPRQPTGQLALIGEANAAATPLRYYPITIYIHALGFVLKSTHHAFSRDPPEFRLATGPGEAVYPSRIAKSAPRNSPYESIRHVA